ncbi:NAD(P)H dehydrogenase (quinone) FQR1, partial [Mucuna pruriens]
MYGHVEKLAREMVLGVNSVEVAQGYLWQVPETLPTEEHIRCRATLKSDVPIIEPIQLFEADGFVFGFPTRFGMMADEFKTFLDTTHLLWKVLLLVGKPARILYSTSSQSGGQETTPPEMFEMKEVKGGSPYGAGTYTSDGSRQPTKLELEQAFHQGSNMATIAKQLKEDVNPIFGLLNREN